MFNIGAGIKLCAAGVVYVAEEDAVVLSPERDQVMLKSKQYQVMQPTAEDITKDVRLYEGCLKGRGVSSSCPFSVHFHIINEFTQHTNSVTETVACSYVFC